MNRKYAALDDRGNDEGGLPDYWPAHTIDIGRFRVSYCELMQYVFAVGLLSVIGFVVFGLAGAPPRPQH